MKKSISIIVSIASLVFVSQVATAQGNTNLGFSLPHFIDNQVELSVQHKLQRRVVLVGVVGGSSKTRGFFSNDGINRNRIIDYNYQEVSNTFSDRSAGFYGKVGINFLFALPEFFDETPLEKTGFRFFVGPVVGVSRFNQSGRIQKYSANSDGTSVNSIVEINEKGTVSGTGFNIGMTFGANKDFSTDLGIEYLGFERKSELRSTANTLGLGVNPILRVNYNF